MKNKSILITGSGYLAKQLIKDISKLSPKKIIIYSRSESKQAMIKESLSLSNKKYDEMGIYRFYLGDIRDIPALDKAMQGVDICINTAALKRIDTCQDQTIEAVNTNVIGVINLINSALKNNIECLTQISTDKAMHPETTYGATKYLAEELMRHAVTYRGKNRTKFKIVRYGNVLNSTGSVLTIWKKQYELGRPLTVRSKKMTRFFMTVEQASRLVIETIKNGKELEINTFPMDSVNIYDLARYLYPKAGIIITGLSHDEKIHETLYEGYRSDEHLVSPEKILKGAMK